MHVASRDLHSEQETLLAFLGALAFESKQAWLFWSRWSQQSALCSWGGEVTPASLAPAPLEGLCCFCTPFPMRTELLWLCPALEQAAQGSGGITSPGVVKKSCRYGPSGHGSAGTVVLGWRLDLMILEVFSDFNDLMME